MPGEGRRGDPPLAYLLLAAGRAFDEVLRTELSRRNWPRLSGAQSLVFAFLDPAGTRPAELARRLGTTRQATQDLVGGLVRLGLLQVAEDPSRRRGRLVLLTDTGSALSADAGTVLRLTEASLGQRADELRQLLTGLVPQVLAATSPADTPAAAVDGAPLGLPG
ncbi:MarR family winged helix-turn-helix transcriptional regulator [Geodermatophilus nigrescens]